ncbi:lysine biosynthesis protein LysX [Haloferax mediterranei ATCC 33500]|uniref:L-2-aminoadipate N-acetyltransferase n=1 Tax=Haloferax mediterranei (strain ATCC 33500 / DSM 1411 / JCM 8866 / NBRC 14739 / NCIMB 2177 / R-4) TaxID=523841 RepID=I3R0N0_HALMT|nr:lysine biosynthesis protein LysX [Haloferax mediterranei]AFK17790.1 L-2-aminoadipate N-acetyltransferase [Haloferax mediterranei ATCC 33500]AHZ22782.1 lysine biosynthesis protein LysX [Haloferax mediterranei ATCC 33500]EMA02939.1 L-2-aminoadipate N-acetyltransferase [Haloferax mediterranei ATCC 33500]MDX5987879.1 lysine biosynthesis protein LysX [Haloferax mediterranei ATCC 33500]QCQ74353.1 lysine biosynthesis protein LysX [Haloferax mediterranei ATCC 33500]
MNIGLLYSRIRRDEKLLLNELRERGHEVTKIDVRKEQFDLTEPPESFDGLDVVVDRCLATSRSLYITRFLQSYGIPVVNSHETADICADKAKNSLALADAGVPTPNTKVAFTVESAMDIVEEFGYPCVLKPVVGSWGRLMAKIDSEAAAEAILEHKATLGNYEHKVFYIQEFVEKPGRDIRVLAVDGEPIAAMTRSSDHWLTNAAKGADAEAFELDARAKELVKQASDAVGGGLLGVDLMETGSDYTVHEVNHTVEFKALNDAVDVDVPAAVVDWLEATVEGEKTLAGVSA